MVKVPHNPGIHANSRVWTRRIRNRTLNCTWGIPVGAPPGSPSGSLHNGYWQDLLLLQPLSVHWSDSPNINIWPHRASATAGAMCAERLRLARVLNRCWIVTGKRWWYERAKCDEDMRESPHTLHWDGSSHLPQAASIWVEQCWVADLAWRRATNYCHNRHEPQHKSGFTHFTEAAWT